MPDQREPAAPAPPAPPPAGPAPQAGGSPSSARSRLAAASSWAPRRPPSSPRPDRGDRGRLPGRARSTSSAMTLPEPSRSSSAGPPGRAAEARSLDVPVAPSPQVLTDRGRCRLQTQNWRPGGQRPKRSRRRPRRPPAGPERGGARTRARGPRTPPPSAACPAAAAEGGPVGGVVHGLRQGGPLQRGAAEHAVRRVIRTISMRVGTPRAPAPPASRRCRKNSTSPRRSNGCRACLQPAAAERLRSPPGSTRGTRSSQAQTGRASTRNRSHIGRAEPLVPDSRHVPSPARGAGGVGADVGAALLLVMAIPASSRAWRPDPQPGSYAGAVSPARTRRRDRARPAVPDHRVRHRHTGSRARLELDQTRIRPPADVRPAGPRRAGHPSDRSVSSRCTTVELHLVEPVPVPSCVRAPAARRSPRRPTAAPRRSGRAGRGRAGRRSPRRTGGPPRPREIAGVAVVPDQRRGWSRHGSAACSQCAAAGQHGQGSTVRAAR